MSIVEKAAPPKRDPMVRRLPRPSPPAIMYMPAKARNRQSPTIRTAWPILGRMRRGKVISGAVLAKGIGIWVPMESAFRAGFFGNHSSAHVEQIKA